MMCRLFNRTRMLWTMVAVLLLAAPASAGQGWVNVQEYLPEGWQEDAQLDLREHIQEAINENPRVFFPGGDDPENPLKYHITAGLEIPSHHEVDFGPHHRLVRLPSDGHMITMQDHAHLSGAIIDGNKYAHWPEFQDLGKSDSAVQLLHYGVVEDVVVYNTPGIAFFSYGNYNKLYRCRVENAGYIDVKFGSMSYRGARDRWSGDGFYFRGTGNLIKDCEAYDTQRWDFCSSHSGAKQNTYVDCRGGDVEYRSYGFIDIEGADSNNRLIRCISPNTNIAIPGSSQTEVIQCMASRITLYDHENPESVEMYGDVNVHAPVLKGNITTNGGIVLGGWSSRRDRLVPGAASPIVINNRMYKQHAGASDQYSDWSFSVHSTDGNGIVANNILFEFDDGYTRGPGMNLDNIEGQNNQVVYGEWGDIDLPEIQLKYGYYDHEHIRERAQAYAHEQLKEYLAASNTDLSNPAVHWLPLTSQFVKDEQDQGEAENWSRGLPDDEEVIELRLTNHWNAVLELDGYHGPGWYYLPFEWPAASSEQDVYLFASGIDSEARIFLNGTLVGEHSGWDEPSLTKIDPEARDAGEQKQLLTLKVWTPAGMAGVYGPLALVVAD